MPGVRGRRFLGRVLDRVYAAAQEAQNEEECELYSVTLQFIGLLRDGWRNPFECAWMMGVGLSMEKYQRRCAERRAFRQKELDRAIPDFDPAEAKRASQRFGRWRFEVQDGEEVHMEELSETTLPAERKPVRRASPAAESQRTQTRRSA